MHRRPSHLLRQARAGYTILELCMVLLIAAIFFAAVLPNLAGVMTSERLKRPAAKLEEMAKTARNCAVMQQRPYEIVVTETGLQMRVHEAEAVAGTIAGGTATADPLPGETMSLDFDGSYELMVLPWGEEKFQKPANQTWVFLPTGLCAPWKFKLLAGDAYLEQAYDPLTGSVADESWYLP